MLVKCFLQEMDIILAQLIHLPLHYSSVKHLQWKIKDRIIIYFLHREMMEYILMQTFIVKEKVFKNLVYILILK